jgi:hypothetical protein
MPVLDQFGNVARAVEPLYDFSDPFVAATWGRRLEAETLRGGSFDGPRIVNEHGEPVTAAAPGARLDPFFGSALDGCPLLKEGE